jgi:hypothetical protein
VVGTTEDAAKAKAAAANINNILFSTDAKGKLWAKVVQPEGKSNYFVTIGDLGSPEKAASWSDFAKEAAIRKLAEPNSEEAKQAASLMLMGQVIDARAMFTPARAE